MLHETRHTYITDITNQLLAKMKVRGSAELVSDFAMPLPVTVIAQMIGVPDNDRNQFHAWSKSVVTVTNNTDAVFAIPSIYRFLRYLRKLIALRTAEFIDSVGASSGCRRLTV